MLNQLLAQGGIDVSRAVAAGWACKAKFHNPSHFFPVSLDHLIYPRAAQSQPEASTQKCVPPETIHRADRAEDGQGGITDVLKLVADCFGQELLSTMFTDSFSHCITLISLRFFNERYSGATRMEYPADRRRRRHRRAWVEDFVPARQCQRFRR